MNDTKKIFETYCDLVTKVTSEPSLDVNSVKEVIEKIQNESEIDVPRILTAALGLSSEAGEFTEIVKKIFLQGKPADKDNVFHMKRELGDIMWYWVTACMALNLDPTEVILENQKKLEARYGEKFIVDQSEVRAKGDL
jgi:MazG nucleotide pyrophosphohydrolase domain.